MAAAYEILSDSNKRAAYDSHGMEGMASGRDGVDPADFFAHFFRGGGGGGSGSNPMFGFDFGNGGSRTRDKGEDSVIPYEVTLEDLYNGKSVKMNMEKEIICSVCQGSGARGNAKPKSCSTCDGKGWTPTKIRLPTGAYGASKGTCNDCHGIGERLKEKDRCKKCKGEATVTEKTRQEIFIEKGMADRQRIVLAGGGDQQPGIPAGDVIFVLKASPHESFERSRDNLLIHVTITLSEALFGFSRIILTHLDGRGVKLSTPPGKIIKPDDTIILRGEGMPVYRRPDEKGDLYVVLHVEMPDDQWLKTVDISALAALLPPKRTDVDPQPAIVDEADFEESDILDFGENEDDWEDEDEDDEDNGEPDCRPQ